MQRYYVYENWTRDRGRIHKAECPFCNHGEGYREVDPGTNGKWHRPYDERAFAFKFADTLKRADKKPCGTCDP